MSTPVQPPTPTRPPTGVLVASTLCWIWGILCTLTAVALGIPAIAEPTLRMGLIVAAVFLICGVIYCVAGFLIRRRNPVGGWIAIISAGVLSALELLALATTGPRNLGALATFGINITIVLVLIFNWRSLRVDSPQVGA
jgi:uncharacterized membrane protein (DUF2068 family)